MSIGKDSPEIVGSGAGSISSHDLKRAAVQAGIVALSAALTYAGQWASGATFGPWQGLVVTGLALSVDLVRRFSTSTQVVLVAPSVQPPGN
jgi:hypothetical protein